MTARVTSYVLDRPDLGGTTIISDMGGYEDPNVPRERLEAALAEAQRADLLLLVISAVNAARSQTEHLLSQLRDQFATQPALRPPPVVVVLTHIDVLRPHREWTPPYNIVSPDSAKAQSIRGALHAVSTDLRLPTDLIVPVCLLPERLYNVEEALVPLLVQVLPDAKRTLLLRSLRRPCASKRHGNCWGIKHDSRTVAVATQRGGFEKGPGACANPGKHMNASWACPTITQQELWRTALGTYSWLSAALRVHCPHSPVSAMTPGRRGVRHV